MLVNVYSHNFSVQDVEPRFEGVIKKFTRQMVEYERVADPVTGSAIMKSVRTYAVSPIEKNIIRFHISLYEDFLLAIKNHPDLINTTSIVEHKCYLKDAKPARFKIKNIHQPRDYQAVLIEQACLMKDNNFIITLPPGAGKTLTAMHILSRLKTLTFVIMRGGYLDRWIPDLEKTFDLSQGRLLTVRGQTDLINLMEMQEDGVLECDIIMSTIDTLAGFFKEYDKFPHIRHRYPFKPHEIFQKLGVGCVLFDEGHQNPHKAMRVFCNTHVPLTITLSATLTTKDQFKNNIYKLMYPEHKRHDAGYKNVYIGVNALMYKMRSLKGIKTTGWQGAYSHVNFEQSLLRSQNRLTLSGYLGLVKYSIDLKFMKDYRPGTKCLIFFATKKMCDKAVKYLSEKFPQLKTVRYISGDKMAVLEQGDLIVSTVLSAGTAVDIVNLRTSIMTTAIDSQISNEQSIGRTRPVKDYPDITPEFCYFVCLDIPKHMTYHHNKREVFKGNVKYHIEVSLPYAA